MVRDKIVSGISNQQIREKFIKVGSNLTLVKAMEIVSVQELSKTQAKCVWVDNKKINTLRKKRNLQNNNTNYFNQANINHHNRLDSNHAWNTRNNYVEGADYLCTDHRKCPAMEKFYMNSTGKNPFR